MRSFVDRSGRVTEERIWRDENDVYIERSSGNGKKTKALEIPEGATLAFESFMTNSSFGPVAHW